MIEVRVPDDLWVDDDEGVLSAWLYVSGDAVSAGVVIAQVMLEKAQMDLLSPASGTLTIEVLEESPIRKGQRIARIEAD